MTQAFSLVNLEAEIRTDPEDVGYRDAGDRAGWLERITTPDPRFGTRALDTIPMDLVRRFALARGLFGLWKFTARGSDVARAALAETALEFVFGGSFAEFPKTNSDVMAQIDGLVAAGLFASPNGLRTGAQNRDDLFALGDEALTRAEQLWGDGFAPTADDMNRIYPF